MLDWLSKQAQEALSRQKRIIDSAARFMFLLRTNLQGVFRWLIREAQDNK